MGIIGPPIVTYTKKNGNSYGLYRNENGGITKVGLGNSKSTSKSKSKKPPAQPHLFTYKSPLFTGNAASFYGLVIPVSLGRRSIVGVPCFVSPVMIEGANNVDQGQAFIDFGVSIGYEGAQAQDLEEIQVLRIWADGTLIYDALASTGWNTAQGVNFRVYKGTEEQMPDPLTIKWLGEDLGIGFRGEVYVMFEKFPLTRLGLNHVPIMRIEVRDSYNFAAVVEDFIRLGDLVPFVTPTQPMMMDWGRQRLVTYDNAPPAQFHVFDILNSFEIAAPTTVTGMDFSSIGAMGMETKYGYIIAVQGSTNTCPFIVIDPLNGGIVSTWGATNSNLDNHEDGFSVPNCISEMRINNTTFTQQLIVETGFVIGPVGVLQLSDAGVLDYAWHKESPYTIFDIWDNLLDVPFFCCPGDLCVNEDAATAYTATRMELNRLCITRSGDGHFAGRHVTIWYPPAGHHISFVFPEQQTDDIIVITRDMINNSMWFSRVHLTDLVRGKIGPLVTPPDITDMSTTLWTAGPIPNISLPGAATATGAAGGESNELNLQGFHQGSRIGSTNTIGYHTISSNTFTLLNIADGTWTTFDLDAWTKDDISYSSSTTGGALPIIQDFVWNGDGSYFFGWSTVTGVDPRSFGPAKIYPVTPPDGQIPLYTILEWLMEYAGFASDDIDVSHDLSDTFTGAIVAEQTLSVWDMLDDMSKALQFEFFESEGNIKFTKVGRGSSLSITYTLDPDDDLLAIAGGDDEGKGNDDGSGMDNGGQQSAYAAFSTQRDWNLDAPQTIELHYLDETQEYTVNIARANKTTFPVSTTENDGVLRLDVPLIMTPAEAIGYAVKTLYELYQGQTIHEFHVGSKYLRMEPGDVVALTINDIDYTMKIKEATLNADFSVSCLGTGFCTNADSIALTGEEPLNNGGQVINGPSISQGFVVDTPPLTTLDVDGLNDGALRIYNLVTSYGQAGWLGADMLYADAAAGPYAVVLEDTVTGGTYFGYAQNAISGGLSSTTDLLTELDVFFSVLPEEIDASGGFLLIGKPNRWEFIQYGAATVATGNPREYTFTSLVRGLRGTEWHMRDHELGDFVTLYPNSDHLRLAVLDESSQGDLIFYKAVGVNQESSEVAPRSFTENVNFEKPWAPTSLKAITISGGSSGLTLSWMRRTRLQTQLGDGITGGQPLEEGWTEGYEIDIYSSGGTILRTVTGVASSPYTYASGDVTTDFGAVPATLHFAVYQISPVVGRGFAGEITTDVLSAT